jgi:mannose-6-phosphate isomerase-like protein (cupin superfamily)
VQHLDKAAEFTPPGPRGVTWTEHLRVPLLSVGTYCVPAGGVDVQSPHTEDEVYVVLGGKATFVAGGQRIAAQSGTVLYVPANEEHRFVDVAEDLTVLVVFAPPEHSRQ